jgi:hypothetical protein
MHVYWDDEAHTIIRTKSEGAWTWDEYHRAMDEINRLMREVSHRVDLINIRNPASTMPGGAVLPRFGRALHTLPDNFGVIILVSNSVFARAMIGLFSQFYGGRHASRVLLTATVEEARAKIAEDRAKA